MTIKEIIKLKLLRKRNGKPILKENTIKRYFQWGWIYGKKKDGKWITTMQSINYHNKFKQKPYRKYKQQDSRQVGFKTK